MAWNRHRNRIRCTCAGYCAGGGWTPDRLCNLTVRLRHAEWQRLQVRPNTALECRRLDVEWQSRARFVACDLIQEHRRPYVHGFVITLATSEREFPLQPLGQLVVRFRKLNRADTFVRGRH